MKTYDSMAEAWPMIARHVLALGYPQPVRDGLDTVELIDYQFAVADAVGGGVPIGIGRKVGRKMMLIDGLNNLAARSYPDVFIAIAPFLGRFADPIERLPLKVADRVGVADMLRGERRFWQGQYGPRMRGELDKAVAELQADPSSRRAVVNVWDSETDYDRRWRDRPCVSQFQLLIRDGELLMFTTMRSNDLWAGLTYDVGQMGQLQAAAASVLGVKTGLYRHRAISLHAYSTDKAKIQGVIESGPVDNPREVNGPDWSGVRYDSIHDIRARFNKLGLAGHNYLYGDTWRFLPENPVEAWYDNELRTAINDIKEKSNA